ncbi:MAG: sensor histidine kinase [Sedimentibacter sp.]
MIINKKIFFLTKAIVLTILFLSALYFENAQQQRLLVLIFIFFLFISNNIYKYFSKKESKIFSILFIIDLMLIYILELNSRLLINYFLHSFYIIILLESSISLETKKGIIIGIACIIVSMIKFIYLIYYKFNLLNISQMVFFLLINILILIVAIFAQYNKQEKEKKDILYKELLDTHKRLKEYTDEVQRLSVIEERNRIARDIHDNLGHNMTALIMQLQMADHYLQSDSPKSQELLANSIQTAKDSLKSIREVVETLRGKTTSLSPEKAIQILVEEFSEKTGTEIELNIKGKVNINQEATNAMYHILQEGLTNAVRHGNASKIWVNLIYTDQSITFSIKDNGIGAKTIKEGYGMKGIKERVNAFNGSVEFKSENGFLISGIIYL